jgi:putative colanic acid biosynthesis glycosyltransferase WcaI
VPNHPAPSHPDPPKPRVRVLYHFFSPDDAVSARHFDDLCEGLAARGFDVEARPSNRGCRDESKVYPREGQLGDVRIVRVWRPPLSQASTLGRFVNSLWMIGAWSAGAFVSRRTLPDVLVVGTDPIFSVLVCRFWRTARPGVRLVHWAFDLYPEAAVADGLFDGRSLAVRMLRRAVGSAYRACDVITDIGPCMRRLIDGYDPPGLRATITPWALVEPPAIPRPVPARRAALFGDAALCLLYSGNYGRAHACEPLLGLARRLESESVRFVFAARGNRFAELEAAVRGAGPNVSIVSFEPQERLLEHLGSADVHLASLRPEWAGAVVPSKFFGSLAIGRPVLFAGPEESSVAAWIREHRVGWILDERTIDDVVADLCALARDPGRLSELQRRCFDVYRQRFSREIALDGWERTLREALSRSP